MEYGFASKFGNVADLQEWSNKKEKKKKMLEWQLKEETKR